jgi:thimet oligopeptidase
MRKAHACIPSVLVSIAIFLFSITHNMLFAQQNPLIDHNNDPIPFNKITNATIREASAIFYKEQEKRIQKISAIPAGQHTVLNTLMAFDVIQNETIDFMMKTGLIHLTFSSDSLRNLGLAETGKASGFYANLFLNGQLYEALRQFGNSASAQKMPPPQKKYLAETMLLFEKNGMKMADSFRIELRPINEKIAALELQFGSNISKWVDSLSFSAEELNGVPADILARCNKQGQNYIVRVNQPNWRDIMKFADNESTRYKMYMHYYNRAYPANISVLDSLIYYRQVLAQKLGFKTYASYALIDKMATNPANAWDFLNDLVARSKPMVSSNIKELSALKKQLNPSLTNTIYDWDIAYYSNKLLEKKYQLNTAELREYFEFNNTIQGIFTIYEKLFNIQIRQTKGIPVWHEKVTSYELYMDGKKMGSFYFDLFSRPGKYTHNQFAIITPYQKTGKNEILPVAALICNLPEGTAKDVALLNMENVTILFHEFGHLVHGLVSHTDIASQAFYYTKGDFVEAPSQFLENWLYEYDALKIFARHYKTGEVLPKSLFEKVKQSELMNVGARTMYQLYNALIDFTFHDKYDSIKGKQLNEVSKSLNDFRQMPFAEGSHWIANFIHLQGYAANYYGYLWSKVFAKDMFSIFQKNGVMDTKTGIRYRKEVLEKGASVPEMEMLRKFLGREPNSEAFMRSMGLN